MKTAKKKRGRPPTNKAGPFGGRLSKTRTFRVRGGMDDRLKERAEAAGRSVSEEIEARLDRSFYLDDVLAVIAGKKAPLIQALSAAVGVSFNVTSLMDEGNKFLVLKAATAIIIDHMGGRTIPADRSIEFEALRAEFRAGRISAADVTFKLICQNVARQVLWDLGLIRRTPVSMAAGRDLLEALLVGGNRLDEGATANISFPSAFKEDETK
jgi:hypothetical protein